jgi:hypothetical protein
MISLDDDELAIVMTLAAPLHPTRRGAFLEAVMQEAAKHAETGPGLINRIARALQRRFAARRHSWPSPPAPPGSTSGGDSLIAEPHGRRSSTAYAFVRHACHAFSRLSGGKTAHSISASAP